MIEIEFKYELTEKQYQSITDKFVWNEEVIINNYYYDNPEYILFENDITLRARQIDNIILLESKVKAENLGTDPRRRVSKEDSERLDIIPQQLDQDTVYRMTGIMAKNVICLGELITIRKIKRMHKIVLSLDKCTYFGKTDYELEIEVEDEKELPDIYTLFGFSGLKESDGKRARFIKERRKWVDDVLIR